MNPESKMTVTNCTIRTVISMARNLFKPNIHHQVSSSDLRQLTAIMGKLKKTDLGFDPSHIQSGAPCTYIEIGDDRKSLSVTIFALQKDESLPIHNHSGMFGLLKCIHGTISVQSFTPNNSDQQTLFATKHVPTLYSETDSNVAVVEPVKNNIHRIHAINGPAAFIDILSPPYSSKVENCCSYYKLCPSDVHKETGDTSSVTLQRISCPCSYFCKNYHYCGPSVEDFFTI